MNNGKTCCTNGYENTSNDSGNELFNTAFECCEDGLGMGNSGKCPFEDVCFPIPPTPTPPAVNTPMPTFGSTPTVSKETTGPPTLPADRGGRNQRVVDEEETRVEIVMSLKYRHTSEK